MSKRRFNSSRSSSRPIDKQLIVVHKTTLVAVDQSTVLATLAFPCTIMGIRWSLDMVQSAGTAEATGSWAIVLARDGVTIDTMGFPTDGAGFFEPKQNVLAFGTWAIDNHTETKHVEGNTKTMRKMQVGDQLVFIARGAATNESDILGVVQLFCKS